MPEPLLCVLDLSVEVRADGGWVRAVDGISFEVEAGRVTALVGESGSGKSLTALAAMRLLPPGARPGGGRVLLEGEDLLRLGERAMRRVRGGSIGIVFQEPMSALNPVLRVGAQVAEAVLAHERVSGRAARARTLELFREVGIPEAEARLEAYPHELSGGLKQRVCIAMALAARPKVLIADEPTTALDVTVQKQVLDLIGRLGHEQGLGVLLITHDLGVVREVADRVCVMYLGRLVERAPVEGLFERPLHPYTQGLFRSVPRLGQRRARLDAVPGTVPPLTRIPSGCRFRTRCPLADAACEDREPPLDAPPPEVAGGGAADREVACVHVGAALASEGAPGS